MRYMGGKTRIAKQLASIINLVREPGQWVWDPFCGGLSMSVSLSAKGPVWSTDSNAALIALYQAVKAGWQPPESVSREEYQAAKALPDSDPLKAFCGFGCSFGGKWFGGYARSGNRNYAANCAGSLKATPFKKLKLSCVNLLRCEPRPTNVLLYLDPPYSGTTGYKDAFDSDLFFRRAADWSAFTHVFISEYASPIGRCVWEGSSLTTCTLKKENYKTATERLFWLPKGGRV